MKASMDTTSWDESPLEFPASLTAAAKMTRVRTERIFKGALIGKGVAFYNMVYHPNESKDPHGTTATFTGLMYFSGDIEGKGNGDIIFKSTGNYGSEGAICQWESDPKTGTGELAGLQATGGYGAMGSMGSEVNLVIASSS